MEKLKRKKIEINEAFANKEDEDVISVSGLVRVSKEGRLVHSSITVTYTSSICGIPILQELIDAYEAQDEAFESYTEGEGEGEGLLLFYGKHEARSLEIGPGKIPADHIALEEKAEQLMTEVKDIQVSNRLYICSRTVAGGLTSVSLPVVCMSPKKQNHRGK